MTDQKSQVTEPKDSTVVDKSTILKRLLRFSKLTKVETPDSSVYIPKSLSGAFKEGVSKDQLSSLFSYYVGEILESKSTDRINRYKEYMFMDGNSTEASLALDTYADETVQLGKTSTGIIIDSEDADVKLELTNLFKRIGLSDINKVRDIARNLCKYGDKPAGLEIGEHGVVSMEMVDVFQFERIEKIITLDPTTKKLSLRDKNDKIGRAYTINQTPKLFSKEDMEDVFKADEYRPFLLGFRLYNKIVPPWAGVHWRLFSSEPEFYPYGRAVIESIRSTYRHLIADEILMSLLRATKFDKLNYNIEFAQDLPGTEIFSRVEEFRKNFNDYVVGNVTRQHNPSMVTDVWTASTPSQKFGVKALGTKLGTDGIDDIEYRRDKLLMGTRLPKGYLLADSSYKVGGDTLIQEDLKLARLIYTIQSAVLSGAVRIAQIHLVSKGMENKIHSFNLSLPYPVPSFNLMELKNQQERLKIVDEFGRTLKETFGITKVPLTVVKKLLLDVAHMNTDLVNFIITELNISEQGTKSTEESPSSTASEKSGVPKISINQSIDKAYEKINESLKGNIVKDPNVNPVVEWISGDSHYYRSDISVTSDDILSQIKHADKYNKLLENIDWDIKDTKTK